MMLTSLIVGILFGVEIFSRVLARALISGVQFTSSLELLAGALVNNTFMSQCLMLEENRTEG